MKKATTRPVRRTTPQKQAKTSKKTLIKAPVKRVKKPAAKTLPKNQILFLLLGAIVVIGLAWFGISKFNENRTLNSLSADDEFETLIASDTDSDALAESDASAQYAENRVLGDSTPPGKFVIHLSPTGSDSKNGASASQAVKTLNRAQRILKAAKPQTDVEIRIKKGTYWHQSVEWSHFIPGRTISFMPSDYKYGEGLGKTAGRPSFVGNKDLRALLRVKLRNAGQTTGLRFYYLHIEKYWAAGISINGLDTVDLPTNTGPLRRAPANSGANGNTFYGLYIENIGNKPTGLKNGQHGYAGIQLGNSSNNVVRNSTFENLVNSPGESHIHGLYIVHGSSNNVIRDNIFRGISGSPVKVRNSSNNNDVRENRFENSGIESAFYDSHQEGKERSPLVKDTVGKATGLFHGDECASFGNIFRNNKVGKKFKGSGDLPVVSFRKGDNKYAGKNKACPNANGRIRVSAGNNDRINQ